MKVKIKKLHPNAVIPKYAYSGDAGLDLTAISKRESEDYIEYGTGLAFELPDNYVSLIFPRSSVSKTNMLLANCVAVIDAHYRGEYKFRFRKLGKKEYELGDRIAQLIIIPFPRIELEEVEELSYSQRGNGNFGSSGH